MQVEWRLEDSDRVLCNIPASDQEVLPGVSWGLPGQPFTPAFWKFSCAADPLPKKPGFGNTLLEEVVACLLGGHGVQGELGVAAFRHLKSWGALSGNCPAPELERMLRQPLIVRSRKMRYRYPAQKARYIESALTSLQTLDLAGLRGADLRNALTGLKGVGLKTASWIVRNWDGGDDVAILDIHVHRAGVLMGLFDPNDDVRKHYIPMESKYLALAKAMGISAGAWDHRIWHDMRIDPLMVRAMLMDIGVRTNHRCGLPPANGSRP